MPHRLSTASLAAAALCLHIVRPVVCPDVCPVPTLVCHAGHRPVDIIYLKSGRVAEQVCDVTGVQEWTFTALRAPAVLRSRHQCKDIVR